MQGRHRDPADEGRHIRNREHGEQAQRDATSASYNVPQAGWTRDSRTPRPQDCHQRSEVTGKPLREETRKLWRRGR